jgi:5-methylcytosine-specific restriction endonuclease McrA
MGVGTIIRNLKKDAIIQHYSEKNRLIAGNVYAKLKDKKRCDYCHKKFGREIPEIHHKISVNHGGSNDESNLMSVHHRCHKILDSAQESAVTK